MCVDMPSLTPHGGEDSVRKRSVRQVYWCMSIIPALRRLRQEAHEFEASLNYIERPPSQKTKKERKAKSPFSQL
jgi:hypothetical protein